MQFLSRLFLTLPETRGNTVAVSVFPEKWKPQSEPSEFCQSLKDNMLENISGSLSVTSAKKLKPAVYDEEDKQKIVNNTSTHGFAAAVRKFKLKFPNINESTVHLWVKKYEENLKEKAKQGQSSYQRSGMLEVHYFWMRNMISRCTQ